MRIHEILGDTMKKFTQSLLVVSLGLCTISIARAYTGNAAPGGGINGTVHDLNRTDTGMGYTANPDDPLTRICIFCHAPHHTWRLLPQNGGSFAGSGPTQPAPDVYDYLPLWNHELTMNYTQYQMYTNGIGAPTQGPKALQAQGNMTPGSASLLCLSCHDGSVAVNSYGNPSQVTPTNHSVSTGNKFIGQTSPYLIGKDNYLGNHHPIGFDYDQVQAVDNEIRPADAADLGAAGKVRDHLYGPGNTKLECATCHAVHNKGNTGEALLWRSDQNSRLCLTCHDKGTDPGTTIP